MTEHVVARPSVAERRPRRPGTRRSSRVGLVVLGAVLAVGALATSFPFLWMVTSSFKPPREAVASPPTLLPSSPSLDAYVRLFTELDFTRYLLNTLAVVAIGGVGLVFMAMAGYGFAKFRFRGRGGLFLMVLMTLMIPVQVTMIPTYLILNRLQLTNTLVGIAAPTLVSAFGIFLFRQFMATIPDELLEAARLDGAGEGRLFLTIVLPLSKPILAVQAVLTFIAGWNSFLWPLIIASDQDKYTLSVALSLLNQQITVNPTLQMAGASLMVVPIVAVFILFQKHIVQGFTMSGLK
ncbi:MAG TPA: carbohydrate ABC transporter permease [Actinotalea sp.]|jgi:multiple sugar transport system permease protein